MFKQVNGKIYPMRLVPKTRLETKISRITARRDRLPDGHLRKKLLTERIKRLQALVDAAGVSDNVEFDNGMTKAEAQAQLAVIQDTAAKLSGARKDELDAKASTLESEIGKIAAQL